MSVIGPRPSFPHEFEKFQEWHATQDGVLRFVREMIDEGHATPETVIALDELVQDQMRIAENFALESPYPEPETALDLVFAKSGSVS